MATPSKGRPQITFRIHPAALRILKSRAEKQPGKKSGVGEYVRQVLYAHLGFDSGEYDAASEEKGQH